MKKLKGILENYFGKVAFALSLLAMEVKVFKPSLCCAYSRKTVMLITMKVQLKAYFLRILIRLSTSVFKSIFCFWRGVAEVSGIMVRKYPETPGKLSTLSTMLYKQIVHKLLSLGKGEVDKL